ncbi:MAG: hypothetical protein KatS3mg121_0106 [Gammaproteobacteria bacterium]|nr:MAG: hypothetical protein KatS3mg121_0106 [Gammaproteobacteria bacterium]
MAGNRDDGKRWALLAQLLYLAHWLALPGLALLVLTASACARHPPFAAEHLRRAARLAWAGVALLGVPAALAWWLDAGPTAWAVLLTLLIVLHTALVLAGMINLARALGGRAPLRIL